MKARNVKNDRPNSTDEPPTKKRRITKAHQPRNTSEMIKVFQFGIGSTKYYKMKKKPPADLVNTASDELPQQFKNTWIMKDNFSRTATPLKEVIAQEYFRLTIPCQQKTRFLLDYKSPMIKTPTKVCTISKEISDDISLEAIMLGWGEVTSAEFKQRINDGTYYGLGAILPICLVVNEYDLHPRNLLLDSNGQIFKIDGACSFNEVSKKDKYFRSFTITVDDLKTLPFVKDYRAINWLGSDVLDPSDLFDEALAENIRFRNEIYTSILHAAVMPGALLYQFTLDCVPDTIKRLKKEYSEQLPLFAGEMISRRDQLVEAALALDSFIEFMKSNAAVEAFSSYIEYLRTFKTTGQRGLDMHLYEADIRDRFKLLQLRSAPALAQEENQQSELMQMRY